VTIGGYFKLNYHRLLMASGGYSIHGYWWIFYSWLLVDILFMAIGGYSIHGYWWLFMDINGYFISLGVILLMAIVPIGDYCWLL